MGLPPIEIKNYHGDAEITEKTLWEPRVRVLCVSVCVSVVNDSRWNARKIQLAASQLTPALIFL
jgi:hypothetical protein